MRALWITGLLAFFLLPLCSPAQDEEDSIYADVGIGPSGTAGPDYATSFDLIYGVKTYQFDLDKQFSTFDHFSFKLPVQLAGIGYSGALTVNREYTMYGQLSYCQVMPQPVRINDSLSGQVTGFIFSGYFWGKNLDLNRFNTFISLGFNTGRLRFYENELLRQKNPFFSPKISVQPRIAIGNHLVISVRADYEYDISKPGWRRTLLAGGPKTHINGLRQSGLTLLFCLGWNIFN